MKGISTMSPTTTTCKLTGQDGNAFAVMGRVTQAMRRAGVDTEVVEAYIKDATSGDYDHLLSASMEALDDNNIEWS